MLDVIIKRGERRRRRLGCSLVIALLGGLLVAAPAEAQEPAEAQAAGAVITRQATLRSHPSGFPATGVAARQIDWATVTQDLRAGTLRAEVSLRSYPSYGSYADIFVAFGRLDASHTCVSDPGGTLHGTTERFTGGPLVVTAARPAARTAAWNCAVAMLLPPGSTSAQDPYDVVVGRLSDVRAKASLGIAAIDPPLVKRKKWAKVRVTVRNTGTDTARSVRLSGKGSGVTIKKRSFGSIKAGASVTRTVKVRLTASSARTLTLRARGKGVSARRAVKVHPLKKAAAGRWTGKTADGRVSFSVTKGKKARIKGWRGVLRTSCTGSPHGVATYSFPTTRIPSNGVVKRTVKLSRSASITLHARITGKRVVQGRIGYNGPSTCGGASGWTAKKR